MSSWLVRTPGEMTSKYRNKDTYVSVVLQGGLANRIFQILAAQHFAEKTNRKFVLLESKIQENPHESAEATMDQLAELFGPLPLYRGPELEWSLIHEESHQIFTYAFELLTMHKGKNVILEGYFQNERYFPRQPPSFENKQKLNTYFIHLRFGDYMDTKFDIGLVDYYKSAILDFMGNTYSANFLVFTNDQATAKQYIEQELQIPLLYKFSNATRAIDVIKEMSQCVGGICANSSLSWLGGYFQKKPRGKITMPGTWMKGVSKSQMGDFYPQWAQVVPVLNKRLGEK